MTDRNTFGGGLKPDGQWTGDADAYIASWDELRRPLEEAGFRVVALEPGLQLCNPENNMGHFSIPVWAVVKFLDLKLGNNQWPSSKKDIEWFNECKEVAIRNWGMSWEDAGALNPDDFRCLRVSEGMTPEKAMTEVMYERHLRGQSELIE